MEMAQRVVLEVDWFVIDGHKYVKQLAYACSKGTRSDLYTFSLPCLARLYRKELRTQAQYSHKLAWDKAGEYCWWEVPDKIEEIENLFPDAEYFAKGLEKTLLFGQYRLNVNNLEDLGCPVYKELTDESQTT